MPVIRTIAILVAVGLFAVACGGDGGDDAAAGGQDAASTPLGEQQSATPPEPADEPPMESASPTGRAVPAHLDFTSATVAGGTFAGAELAGRDAVLYFWAPWCPICRREMPTVLDAAQSYGSRVTFVGVASSGGLDEMKEFVADTGSSSFTHLADEDGDIWARYGVTYQHTYAFVDDDGTYEIVTGPLSADELAGHIDDLIGG